MSGMTRHRPGRQVRLAVRDSRGLVCRKEAAVPPPAPEPLAFTAVPQGSKPRLAVEPEPQNVDGVHPAAITPDPDDLEPIVVLDDGPSPAALAYLAARGIGADTAAAFRLDTVPDADLARLLTPRQRVHLAPSGIWLPTCDPRQPATITGLIRLTQAQNKHAFIGHPAGIACPVATATAPRVVLVDSPLLGLRLHEHGVAGVAIVEDAAVLDPLTDWLAAREVVIITAAKRGDLVLPAGIVPVGVGRITGGLDLAPEPVLTLLGLDPAQVRAPTGPLPLDPRLPQQLHAYAERQVATKAGQAALAALDLDLPATLRAYRVGFLPTNYHQALTQEQRRMVVGTSLGGGIVLPAFDARGAVVDLLGVRPCREGHVSPTLWEAPRGVCAPVLATACEHVVVTTVPRWVGRLFRAYGPTVLVRDAAQAGADATRLAAGGVRYAEVRCRVQAEGNSVAAALNAAGITVRVVTDDVLRRTGVSGRPGAGGKAEAAVVESAAVTPPADPVAPCAVPAAPDEVAAPQPQAAPALTLVRHDAQAEEAIFRAGQAVYTAQIPWHGRTTVAVTLAVGAAIHRDRFDLAVAPQRLRFAAAASHRVKLPPADLARDLESLLPALLRLVEAKPDEPVAPATSVPGMSDTERDEALTLLRDRALVDRILADLDALGAVGEPEAALVVLLAALSRFGEEPVWACLTASATGERFPLLGILAAITPPDHLLHVSRLTDNALFHGDRDALAHKLLLLDDVGGISPAAVAALKVLQARGVLTGTQVQRDAVRGRMRTIQVEARGPLALVTAATGGVPRALAQQVVEVAVDESPTQAERLCAARQRPPIAAARIVARLVNAQRLLKPLPVRLPADTAIPVVISRHRALHAPFFGLVAAATLLHQHQRPVLEGALIATAADVALASRAVVPLVGQVVEGLGVRARAALTAVGRLGAPTCTIADVVAVMPGWSAMTVRRAVDDLVAAGCLTPERRRNGVQATYRVVHPATGSDLFSFSPPFQATCEGPKPEVAVG
jgi:hypothetical protein